ncbi:MAG: hypothetical protein MR669_03640 [Selenomonadaceae bacterium]|nr:hypothetical protein [Selenomonadaceae bacterium]
MVKFQMSLLIAILAALAICIAGVLRDIRGTTVLFRMAVGACGSGLFVYLVTFILEAKGWVFFDKSLDEALDEAVEEKGDAEKMAEAAPQPKAPQAEEQNDEQPEGGGEEGGFQPLASENLRHVDTEKSQ